MASASTTLRRLGPGDVPLLRALNALFGEAFGDRETYGGEPPTDAYLEGLLGKQHVTVLATLTGGEVSGGLVAYKLDKFERMRREPYIHDLATAAGHRRWRSGTALIEHLRQIAARRGGWIIYAQADHGDDSAIAPYGGLEASEGVLHFDIEVETRPR